jgi:hypothetical protein
VEQARRTDIECSVAGLALTERLLRSWAPELGIASATDLAVALPQHRRGADSSPTQQKRRAERWTVAVSWR